MSNAVRILHLATASLLSIYLDTQTVYVEINVVRVCVCVLNCAGHNDSSSKTLDTKGLEKRAVAVEEELILSWLWERRIIQLGRLIGFFQWRVTRLRYQEITSPLISPHQRPNSMAARHAIQQRMMLRWSRPTRNCHFLLTKSFSLVAMYSVNSSSEQKS